MPSSLTVVVPTYNRPNVLTKCLRALQGQVFQAAFEIIVVDDCSTDATQQLVQAECARDRRIQYIRNPCNSGRCHTRNQGILSAKNPLIVTLDDDIVPAPGFLEAHSAIHDDRQRGSLAAVGSVRYDSDCISGTNIGKYLQSRYLAFRSNLSISLTDLGAQHFGIGNSSFWKDDAICVGLLDQRFRFYGGEDVFFGHQLKKRGVRLCFCPDAKGLHVDEVSFERQKLKVMQSARNGLKILLHEAPEVFQKSPLRYLLAVDQSQDTAKTKLIKACMRVVMNPPFSSMCEAFARATDGRGVFYSSSMFHYLVACWTYAGLREGKSSSEIVSYGTDALSR